MGMEQKTKFTVDKSKCIKREFWFVVGSQFLYGPEVLETVETRAKEMAAELSKALP